MDDRIIELLYRNLQEVFGEGDAARRRAAIEDFYTEDCVLYVPPGVFVGHDALDKWISATYVIGRNGSIIYAYTDVDYRDRADPRDVLQVLIKTAVAA